MDRILKKIWVVLFFFMILGLMMLIPVDKYQKVYLDAYHRKKAAPQKRVDAAYTYVEYLNDGGEPTNTMTAPISYTNRQVPQRLKYSAINSNHRKPLYIRDKNNPNVLHPYRGR